MDSLKPVFSIVDSFSLPRPTYIPSRQTFLLEPNKRSLYGTSDDKSQLYRERYQIIHQRTLRNKLYTPNSLPMSKRSGFMNRRANKEQRIEICQIESLIGREGETVVVFGMITRPSEDEYQLEDLHKTIPLDFSSCHIEKGFLTENSFIIARGQLNSLGKFQVSSIELPPPETREETHKLFGHIDFLKPIPLNDQSQLNSPRSSAYRMNSDELSKILKLEQELETTYFIVISDLWLDSPIVIQRLEKVFNAFCGDEDNHCLPFCILLCGRFQSPASTRDDDESDPQKLSRLFSETLFNVLRKFPSLCSQSQFIFVPSWCEPGLENVIPRPRLSPPLFKNFRTNFESVITEKPSKKSLGQENNKNNQDYSINSPPNLHFVSNPCRIRYCTQHIVVFRDELVARVRKHTIHGFNTPTNNDLSLHEHLSKTIISQAHLSPLPLHVRPIFWNYDHCLRLYPLPDLILVCDSSYGQFEVKESGSLICNPGSFATDGSFLIYRPSTREIELSQV